ncbi:hypothetical protein BBJ28_00025921 [Nothophytophthora sp. Chile5]|nr:hypothetical protein BBJ28_00025921 [Nothophytophthora sp. Chile5]
MALFTNPLIQEAERRRQKCVVLEEYAFSAVLDAEASLRLVRRDRGSCDPDVVNANAHADDMRDRLEAAVRRTRRQMDTYRDIVRDVLVDGDTYHPDKTHTEDQDYGGLRGSGKRQLGNGGNRGVSSHRNKRRRVASSEDVEEKEGPECDASEKEVEDKDSDETEIEND